jgi:leucyl-tRNA synthetase
MVEKYATAGFAERGSDEVRQKTHATIKRVTEDVEGFKFNTAIAAIMELVNVIYAAAPGGVDREAVESVVRLLAPMAPHLAEEMWRRLGHPESEMLVTHPWPTYDADVAAKKQVIYPVQVNGKLRGQVETDPDAARDAVESQARALATVKPWIDGKEVVKVVFVPGRLINFVVRA